MTIRTYEDMWCQYGSEIGAYDSQGKTIAQLAEDYVQTHLTYAAAVRGGGEASSARDELDTSEEAKNALLARLALIERALISAGGLIDAWCDEGACTIYGPNRKALVTF